MNFRLLPGSIVVCVPLSLLTLFACACRGPLTSSHPGDTPGVPTRELARRQSLEAYDRGVKAEHAQRLDEAAKCYAQAVSADRSNLYAWMALGAVEFRRENYAAAVNAFHESARLAPTNYEPYYNLGTIYEAVGRYEDAIKAYDRGLKIAPDQVELVENLARTLVKANRDHDRARQLMEQALQYEMRPVWRDWLQLQLLRLRRPVLSTAPSGAANTAPADIGRPRHREPAGSNSVAE